MPDHGSRTGSLTHHLQVAGLIFVVNSYFKGGRGFFLDWFKFCLGDQLISEMN